VNTVVLVLLSIMAAENMFRDMRQSRAAGWAWFAMVVFTAVLAAVTLLN
jgi:hypothetical protein